MRRPALAAAALAAIITLAGCSSSEEPEAESTPAPTESAAPETPAPTEPASKMSDSLPFGETTELTFDGSTWEITIEQPRDIAEEVAANYEGTGLSGEPSEGAMFVGIEGTLKRMGDGPADPFGEVSIQGIVDGRTVDPNGPTLGDFDAIADIDEMYPDAEAPFLESFEIQADAKIDTVIVSLGRGEAAPVVFYGEPVDLGPDMSSSTEDVETMKYVWDAATEDQKAEARATLGVESGEVTDDSIQKLIETAKSELVIDLTEDEAREFLTWMLEN